MLELDDTFQRTLLAALATLESPLPVEIQSDLNAAGQLLREDADRGIKELDQIVKKYELLRLQYEKADKAFLSWYALQLKEKAICPSDEIDLMSGKPYDLPIGDNTSLDPSKVLSSKDSVSAAQYERELVIQTLQQDGSSFHQDDYTYMWSHIFR